MLEWTKNYQKFGFERSKFAQILVFQVKMLQFLGGKKMIDLMFLL